MHLLGMDSDHYYWIGQGAMFLLFICSEAIGKSKCKYTGVIDLLLGSCHISCRQTSMKKEDEGSGGGGVGEDTIIQI